MEVSRLTQFLFWDMNIKQFILIAVLTLLLAILCYCLLLFIDEKYATSRILLLFFLAMADAVLIFLLFVKFLKRPSA